MYKLEVQDLHKRYGSHEVLRASRWRRKRAT